MRALRRRFARRPSLVVFATLALYVASLAIAWWGVERWAEHEVVKTLTAAETSYEISVVYEVECYLQCLSRVIVGELGTCRPQTLGRMKELAERLEVDEINVVGNDGLAIASNVPDVLGFDFRAHPLTREFLSLTNGAVTWVTQDIRPSVTNPDTLCKYTGLSFADGSGLIQLGVTFDTLKKTMHAYSREESRRLLRSFHFNVDGWYDIADDDYEPGKVFYRWDADARVSVIGRYFEKWGFRCVALLPEEHYYGHRDDAFLALTVILTLFVALFLFFALRLLAANRRVEAMHALQRARAHEDLVLARKIQMSALRTSEGAFLEELAFSFTAATRPAREVGGDFYDFYEVSDGRFVFLVADVSGKGIPGAMFMMEAMGIFRNCLTEFADIAEAVRTANARLCEVNRAELFVTAWIGVLDSKAGHLEYVNAGHNRPFVRRADGTIEKVMGKGGRFLGMFPETDYRTHELSLSKGDILYLYTDGVTEAMNVRNVQFGEARLRAAFTGYNADIHAALRAFVGTAEPSDDLTDLMLRWNGEPVRTEASFVCDEGSLESAVGFIRAALEGLSSSAVAALLNAADEVVSNIVNYSGAHGYGLVVERGVDRVRLRFSDDGVAYNPLSHADPDTHAALEDRPVGGLGLVVVKRLVDRVIYSREGERNVLTLIRGC